MRAALVLGALLVALLAGYGAWSALGVVRAYPECMDTCRGLNRVRACGRVDGYAVAACKGMEAGTALVRVRCPRTTVEGMTRTLTGTCSSED